jgi:hypothetical protein
MSVLSTVSTFRTAEPFLQQLLEHIHSGQIQLPDFQRPWVWDDIHIRELIASVSLSYPIGAIMLMETGGEGARFKPHLVQGVEMSRPPQPDKLILDGQQRLTSLYLALRSGHPVPTQNEKKQSIQRVYYLDILKCIDEDADRLDAVLSIAADRMIKSDFARRIDLDLSTPEKEYENGLFPLDRMLDPARFFEWSNAYSSYFKFDPARIQILNRFQQEIWLRFQQYKLPVIELLKETPKEAVCQVFEKVNTGGVSLTVFELMTASFAADEFELRKDWEQRLARAFSQQPVLQDFDATDLLTSVTLLASFHQHRNVGTHVSCKRKDVLKLRLNEYCQYADSIQEGALSAARLLVGEKVFDAKNLPYKTQLVPLAAICAFLGRRFESEPIRRKLARWYWCGVFGELYGGANETRYALDIQDVIAWIEGGPEPRTIADANFQPTRLLTLQSRQSAAYKGLMARLMQVGSLDFLSGDSIEVTTYFDRAIDIHHVFPAAYCQRMSLDRQLWNSVINKVPLSSYTNRKLGGQAPSRYLAAIEKNEHMSSHRLDEILSTHVIEPAPLRGDHFLDFIRTRASRLLDLIVDATGKPVTGRDTDEVVRAFGAEL